MSGMVNVRLWSGSDGQAVTVEPDRCPCVDTPQPLCFAYNSLWGARTCPYLVWFGVSPSARREILHEAGALLTSGLMTKPGVVHCALAKRNVTAGTWPMKAPPAIREDQET